MPDQDGARIDARALLSGQERLEIQGRPVLLSHSFAFAVCRSVCAQRFAPPRTTKSFTVVDPLARHCVQAAATGCMSSGMRCPRFVLLCVRCPASPLLLRGLVFSGCCWLCPARPFGGFARSQTGVACGLGFFVTGLLMRAIV